MRLQNLLNQNFKNIAKELDEEDHYLYHRAFSPGIQEFIEALIYFNYLKHKRIFNFSYYQAKFEFKIIEKHENSYKESDRKIVTTLVRNDFLLGLLDATGELMRKCINNLGSGEITDCGDTCDFVRNVYSGFLSLSYFGCKEVLRKLIVLKQTLLKIEMVCYNIHIRGNEMLNHILSDIDEFKTYVGKDE